MRTSHMAPTLSRAAFVHEWHGRRTDLFTLRGAGGLQVAVCNHGARPVQVALPDGRGDLVDVALGYDSLQGYLDGQSSMGASIGRWAGRLRNGTLRLRDGSRLQLPTNDGAHHLHGGPQGSRWQVFALQEIRPDALTLSHRFRTEDDDIPGQMHLQLHLQLSADNALHMAWSAQALDAPTVVDITGHAFFNLAGPGSTHGHFLQLPASRYLPLAADICPSGVLADVQGTPLDWRQPRRVGAAVARPFDQWRMAGGLDHYLVLDETAPAAPSAAAPPALPGLPAPPAPPRLPPAAPVKAPISPPPPPVWGPAPPPPIHSTHPPQ